MSRSYVYAQRTEVLKHAEGLDTSEPKSPVLELNDSTIEKIVLTLTMECQSPSSGIQSFFEAICGINVSAGRISNILGEAAKRAKDFDDTIDLSGVSQMAVDEIFQCGRPILTGVGPISAYTFLLEEAADRTADTWALYLDDRKGKGLNPETSINDGGLGLMAGIPQVFPEAEIQADTFHALHNMGKEVSKLERKAHKLINAEHEIEMKLAGKKPRAIHKASLEEIRPKVREAVERYDVMAVLFGWLRTLLNFSGYSLVESHVLAEWVLEEMDSLAVGNIGLSKEVAKVRKILPSLLSFIGRLERGMGLSAAKTGIPADAHKLMYRQMSHSPGSMQDSEYQCKAVCLLGDKYAEARDEFRKLLSATKKASSMVENLNGRIRVFIEVKRAIPPSFFVLLKVFYNTRPCKRSRCLDRRGRSPLEILANSTQPDFLSALGY